MKSVGEPMATKRKRTPTIRISLHTVLTGDTLNRNAGNGYGAEPENPAWVRNARSSP